MNNRYKNIWMWLGLIGVAGAAAGIDATTLTSWNVLAESILNVLKNPYLLGCTALAVLGVITDPTTPGIKDQK